MATFTYPRYPDWTSRWSYFIKDSLDLQLDLVLDWESINCTQFVSQGIEAITGHNPYEEDGWVDTFTTAEGAGKAIRKRGYNTLDEVTEALFPEIPLSFVWPGDLVLIRSAPCEATRQIMPHGWALADPPFFYVVGEQGLGRGDLLKEAIRGFAIGHEVGNI